MIYGFESFLKINEAGVPSQFFYSITSQKNSVMASFAQVQDILFLKPNGIGISCLLVWQNFIIHE